MTTSFRAPAPVHDIVLDTLRLPSPSEDFAPCAAARPSPLTPSLACNDANTVAWYRWLLSHQLVFCTWRLMVEALVAADDETQPILSSLYDAYSALLLYGGSCTPEVYDSVLRSRMRAADPGMSGTWARDHNRVRALQAGLAIAPDSPLRTAIRFNRQVHIAVAARLVPEGRSLLQDSGRSAREQPTEADSDAVDTFFRTERGPICRHEFGAALRVRTEAALADLGARPPRARYDRVAIDDFGPTLAFHIAAPLRISRALLADRKCDSDHC